MIQKKYSDFISSYRLDDRIDENVANAKNYLRNRALAKKKEKLGGDPKIKLTPEEIQMAERDRDFAKIRELCNDSPGNTFAFTKFFFEEEIPLEGEGGLREMYNKLKELKQKGIQLPKNIDFYANVVSTDEDPRRGFEVLIDDITRAIDAKITKKWVDELYSNHKAEYVNSSDVIKEKISAIAKAFDELGMEDGTKNNDANKKLQGLFWIKLKRYKEKPLVEVMQGASSYIKAANVNSISKFLQKVQDTNIKYGVLNGAEVIYDENNVLIIEVKSYQTNKELNSNTSHCIASQPSQWENYVSGDSNFNKQYYIYNYNLDPSDNKSVIGITIESTGRIRACHIKNDSGFSDGIRDYMRRLNIPFEILAPMNPKEVDLKKRRIVANKEIVKPKISAELIKKYIEDGGDPNAKQGEPLINAVKENDHEKAKMIIELGGMPNIGNCIKYSKDLNMIYLLVEAGATVTNEVFKSIQNDYDAIKYLIDAGMNVNFENGYPLRNACKLEDPELACKIIDLLVRHGANISERRYMAVKSAAEYGKIKILDHLLTILAEKDSKTTTKESKDEWLKWASTSEAVDDKIRKSVMDVFKKHFG